MVTCPLFTFSATGVSPGTYEIVATAFSTVTGTENQAASRIVTVPASAIATVRSPLAGSALASRILVWWTPGSSAGYATDYWLDVGRAQGGYELYSGYKGQSHATYVDGLPTTGGGLWIRIYTRINDTWQFSDHQYQAAWIPSPYAHVTSPPVGSVLANGTTITWSEAVGATAYWLDVGTARGGYDLYSGYKGTSLGSVVSGLPSGGGPIWIRIYSYVNGAWQFQDFSFLEPQ